MCKMFNMIMGMVVMTMLSFTAIGAESQVLRNYYAATVVAVTDSNIVTMELAPWFGKKVKVPVVITTINTPAKNGMCDYESTHGKLAMSRLQQLLPKGSMATIAYISAIPGRTGDVESLEAYHVFNHDNKSVVEIMIKENHGVPLKPGTIPDGWCNGDE